MTQETASGKSGTLQGPNTHHIMSYDKLFNQLLEEFDADCADEFAAALRDFHEGLKDKILPPYVNRDCDIFGGAQSKEFMRHLLDDIQAYFGTFGRGRRFRILDVGPGAGEGSNLLGSMYRKAKLGYTAKVDTIDIRSDYLLYQAVLLPHVHPRVGDIYKIDSNYDIVIASHVIEHVPDPLGFCARLQQLSKGIALVCAPFRENPEKMTKGHRHSFDQDFLDSLDADDIRFVESAGWGSFMDPPYQMFIARLSGKGK